MSLTTAIIAATLHADASDAASLHAIPSLPPAGFRVSRVGDLHCAIGMFTTHRAEPSWT